MVLQTSQNPAKIVETDYKTNFTTSHTQLIMLITIVQVNATTKVPSYQ
jgi:hypothetical protein